MSGNQKLCQLSVRVEESAKSIEKTRTCLWESGGGIKTRQQFPLALSASKFSINIHRKHELCRADGESIITVSAYTNFAVLFMLSKRSQLITRWVWFSYTRLGRATFKSPHRKRNSTLGVSMVWKAAEQVWRIEVNLKQ